MDMGSKTLVFRTDEFVMVGMCGPCLGLLSKRLTTLMFFHSSDGYSCSNSLKYSVRFSLKFLLLFNTSGIALLLPNL